MKNMILALGVSISLLMTSCASKLDVSSDYVISGDSLKQMLKQKDESLVLFWTDWCGASKYRIENYYKPLIEKIKSDKLDLQLILLASDANISTDDIDKLRELGILCYYIERPGNNAILNRMSIKKFINKTFPDNEVQRIKKFQYGIPVELWVNRDLKILNDTEHGKSYTYVSKLLEE
jgi:thiol-disulfide isomerase/thioredoxin